MPATAAAESIELRRTFTRVAVASVALLYFALSGLETAISRVNGSEVQDLLAELDGVDVSSLSGSYVLSQRVSSFKRSVAASGAGDGTLQNNPALVADVEERLEALADDWFSVQFSVFGTNASVDLRLLTPLIPYLICVAFAYLGTVHRKIRFVESCSPAAETDAPWQSSAYRNHPHVLIQGLTFLAAIGLLAWFVQTFESLSGLVDDDLWTDYQNTIICSVAYALIYVSDVTRAFGGVSSAKSWTSRLRRIFSWVRDKLIAAPGRIRLRGQMFTGSGLILVTLIAPLATSCEGDSYNGLEYATGWGNTMWFSGMNLLGASLIDFPLRTLYIAALAVAAVAVIAAVAPWRRISGRPGTIIRYAIAISAWVPRLVLLLVVCSIALFGISEDARVVGDVLSVIVWAGFAWFLWLARGDPAARSKYYGTIGLALLPPSLTFGLGAVQELADLALYGVPVLMAGCLIQITALRNLPEPPPP